MNRSASTLIATTATLALAASACGGGKSTEEQLLERALEGSTNGDVDIDFGSDGDGGFSVQTEDGEFSIDFDDEGNFSFDSDAGGGTFEADGDTGGDFSFEGEDGQEANIELDADQDGDFTITGDDGQTVIGEVDEDGDGSFAITGEDGESTFESGPGIPAKWPNDIPRPEGLVDVNGTYISDGESLNIAAIGTPPGDADQYIAAYVAELVAIGFTETSSFSADGSSAFTHERGDITVSTSYTDFGDSGQLAVAINRF